MDELSKSASARLKGKVTNDSARTLCVFASEPIGVVDDLLEVGGVYQLSETLAPLICREIIDYPHFADKEADATAHFNCQKIAYFLHQEKVAQKYRRKASQKQEKTLAKKLGGKVTPGSGAFGFHKGDVTSDKYLVEAKYTDTTNYRLTLRTWNKIKNEAYSVDKIPVMEIVLDQNQFPTKLILISPTDFYDTFDFDNTKFVDTFFSLPLTPDKEDAKSIVLVQGPILAHINDVNYNHEGKLPAFLIQLYTTILIGLETTDFIRMINS
jgi:hypothetical protein